MEVVIETSLGTISLSPESYFLFQFSVQLPPFYYLVFVLNNSDLYLITDERYTITVL